MPSETQIDTWFFYILAFNLLWVFGFLAIGVFRRVQTGSPIFPRRPDHADFYQAMASGRNLRNFISRLGGAHRCLIVMVADRRLRTDLVFPFNLVMFLDIYSLRIDIRLDEITRIERGSRFLIGKTVTVRWSDDQAYEFRVHQPDALIQALDPSGRLKAQVRAGVQ